MRKPTRLREFGCPVEATVSIVGGKWKALVLFHLLSGALRFNELQRRLVSGGAGITQRMLSLQLRELEQDGVIARTVYAAAAPHVEYRLTEFGESLRPLLLAMRAWGADYLQAGAVYVVPCTEGRAGSVVGVDRR